MTEITKLIAQTITKNKSNIELYSGMSTLCTLTESAVNLLENPAKLTGCQLNLCITCRLSPICGKFHHMSSRNKDAELRKLRRQVEALKAASKGIIVEKEVEKLPARAEENSQAQDIFLKYTKKGLTKTALITTFIFLILAGLFIFKDFWIDKLPF